MTFRIGFRRDWIGGGLLASLLCAPAFAGNELIFLPLTPTALTLASTDVARVQYQVTSLFIQTRSFDMTPMTGVHQVTSVAGACASPFVLANNQSCLLTLDLIGAELGSGISGGPVVCVSPDALTCFQPGPVNSLQVVIVEAELFANGFE